MFKEERFQSKFLNNSASTTLKLDLFLLMVRRIRYSIVATLDTEGLKTLQHTIQSIYRSHAVNTLQMLTDKRQTN